MFEYNYNPRTQILNIALPRILHYNFEFMNDMTELICNIMDDRKYCMQVRASCPREPKYDKMCKAYIFNILRNLTKSVKILWNVELNNTILSSVNTISGNKFTEIDVQKNAIADALNDYRFYNDQSVDKPIWEIANVIVEKNFTIGKNEVKEFLTTTIGEIFSNAFLHSEEDELFFIYDIEKKREDFYLCITVIDYGNTIVHNVKEYFEEKMGNTIQSEDCIAWAIIEGNTTRRGSGGYGLSTLINYIQNAKGELIIFSGDAYYRQKEGQEEVSKSNGIFLGTSVMFRIKLFETNNIIGYDSKSEKLISISLENL